MKRYRFTFFLSEGVKGIFRNGLMSAASILILMSSLVVMGCFAAIMINIDFNLESIDDFNEIVCYINLGTEDARVTEIGNEITSLSNVESVQFISKEQALETEKARYGDEYAALFEDYGPENNPLPDAYQIQYKDVEEVDVLVYQLQNIEGIEKVRNRLDISSNIAKLKQAVSVICMWLMVLLLIVSVFVISNTIKLTFHAREREISIMRYIGATKYYITMPFIIEGMIIGLVSSAAAFGVQWYIYHFLIGEIVKDYGVISIVPFEQFAGPFAIFFVAAGLFVGIFGTAISIRRYMKV